MDYKELAELVPLLVAEKLEDASKPVPFISEPATSGPLAWGFTTGQVLTAAAVFPESNELRITLGLAMDMPYVDDVVRYVNNVNCSELVFGRAFLVGNQESGHGAVLMQEIVFGESLSWDFAPSIQNLLRILGTLTGQAARLAPQICSRFHGRAPREDEIMFLLMNG